MWVRLSVSDFPNGAIIFCSADTAAVVHPPHALPSRLYSCGRHFDTTVLRQQLAAEQADAYGIIVVDGSSACIGTAKGLGVVNRSACALKVVANLQSTTAAKTRRGGQSALRYARNREIADLAFLRQVSERANKLLANVKGCVIAGKADAKQRLEPELSVSLRKRIVCRLNLPCDADADALRLAAFRAAEAVGADTGREEQDALADFMERVAKPDSLAGTTYCYGVEHTQCALDIGAVATLLVSTELPDTDDLREAARALGAVVVEVSSWTTCGAEFCKAFQVGACLRWPVDVEQFAADGAEDPCVVESRDVGTPSTDGSKFVAGEDASSSSSSNSSGMNKEATLSDSQAQERENCQDPCQCKKTETLEWLRSSLSSTWEHASEADTLMACVEVILDGDALDEEAIENVVEVLSSEGVSEITLLELKQRLV